MVYRINLNKIISCQAPEKEIVEWARKGDAARVRQILEVTSPNLRADHPDLFHGAFWYTITDAKGNFATAEMLLNEFGADPNTKWGPQSDYSVLHQTVQGLVAGTEKQAAATAAFARLLIQAGADVNPGIGPYGTTPLMIAAREMHLPLVRFLLERGARVNDRSANGWPRDQTALCLVASSGRNKESSLKIARSLLEHGADPDIADTRQETPLQHACRFGTAGMVALLMGHGADVLRPNNKGQTALHQAAECCVQPKAKLALLLDRVPQSVDVRDRDGNTPLHYASRRLHLEAAQLLLDKGADPSTQNHYGSTPLHGVACLSAKGKKVGEMVRLLLEHRADPNSRQCDGTTPLHYAIRPQPDNWEREDVSVSSFPFGFDEVEPDSSHIAALHQLLAYGADQSIKDDRGRTALDLACAEHGNLDAVYELVRTGIGSGQLQLLENASPTFPTLPLGPTHLHRYAGRHDRGGNASPARSCHGGHASPSRCRRRSIGDPGDRRRRAIDPPGRSFSGTSSSPPSASGWTSSGRRCASIPSV